MSNYVLITAAHNEEKFIESTIRSVINQEKKPVEWIIVSDGSTDNTAGLVKQYSYKFNFIRLIVNDKRKNHDFASKVYAIKTGIENLSTDKYDFIGILDADVSFEQNYYSSLIKKFDDNPKLGIAGGKFYDIDGNRKILMGFSPYSVRGATQFFRRQCFESIGGLTPMRFGGEDALACYTARINGWKIENFSDLTVLHLRPTGSVGINTLKSRFRAGLVEYSMGFHPLFQFVKSIARFMQKPLLIGGITRLIGFWWAYLKKEKRFVSKEQINFIRAEQMTRVINTLKINKFNFSAKLIIKALKFKREELQLTIDKHLSKIKVPKILEAGCGSVSKINLPDNIYLVGIDISQKQLDRNYILNEKILGDIQNYEYSQKEFDMIVCWHVLEHLDKPVDALNKFISAVKEDGIIIISSPNPLSVKGLITKFTPHWIHVFVYRFFYGHKDAGKNDTAPFPTILRFFINPKHLLKYARKNNLINIFSFYSDAIDGWVGKSIKNRSRIIFYTIKSLNKIVSILTFGSISHSEYILVFQKNGLKNKINIDQFSKDLNSVDSQDLKITV